DDAGEPEYSADDFIVEEDNVVIVSRDGWVKRQKEVKDLTTTRLREGDAVLAAFGGSTRATCVFFSNFGVAYTCRIIDMPASTGDRDLLTVETSRGAEQTISTAKYEVTGRGGKGRELLQRGQFIRVLWPTPDAPRPLSAVQ